MAIQGANLARRASTSSGESLVGFGRWKVASEKGDLAFSLGLAVFAAK